MNATAQGLAHGGYSGEKVQAPASLAGVAHAPPQQVSMQQAPAPGADSLPPRDDPLAVVNSLHQVLAGAGLHADLGLPQIAVVGSQSVGKTSVLQSLVGRDFLPRGTGIVTRRPLVLQLCTTVAQGGSGASRPQKSWPDPSPASGSTSRGPATAGNAGSVAQPAAAAAGDVAEWAEFGHKLGERFTSFEQVSKEIELETERLCGERQGVSDEPILLRIYSPCVIDLTLVDLPGLTKVPTGDQPADIADRIQNLVLRYISHKSCLILAVTAANSDLATSDALALARQVDPSGDRTLGVLTKLDLADESGNALEALCGKVYPLRLGYVGVVCRSESASKQGVTFEEAIKAEDAFLKQSRAFRPIADQCGVPYLAKRLHELLLRHIKEALPELRTRIQRMADEHRQELESFGDRGLEHRMGQGAFLLQAISGYVRNYADALEGRLAYNQQELPPDRLVGGARLHYIFHRIFAQAVLSFDAFNGISDLEIRVAMRNAAGPKPQLFVPEVAFETLVKRQIQKLEDPCLQCVHLVFEELKHLALQSEVPEMQRFPALRDRVLEVAQTVIKRCVQPTNQVVSNLIRIELAHINVDHPDFIGGSRAISNVHAMGTAACQEPMALQQPAPQAGAPQMPLVATSVPQYLPDDIEGRETWRQAEPNAEGQEGGPFGSTAGGHAAIRRNRWGDLQRPAIAEEPLRLPSVPMIVTPSGEPSEKERMDTELLKSLVSSYYAIVKRKIIDAVPKTIMHFMVNSVRDSLLNECIAELYRNDMFSTLLTEADDVRQRCEELTKKVAELRQALDILSQIRDNSL